MAEHETESDTASGASRRGESAHPDEGNTGQHDQAGRGGGPYVAPGRDEQGNPQPSVPHEGLLGRIAMSLVIGESVVLLVVAIAGYVVGSDQGFTGRSEGTFLALRLNPAHSTLLLVTAVLGLVAALTRRSLLRRFAGAQAIVYLLVFAFGSAYSVNTGDSTALNLNTPDHVLHGVLFILGFVVLMISSARVIEPPPGPDPYPDHPAKQDRDEDGNGDREGASGDDRSSSTA